MEFKIIALYEATYKNIKYFVFYFKKRKKHGECKFEKRLRELLQKLV